MSSANHADHIRSGKIHGDCQDCQSAMRNYAMKHKASKILPEKAEFPSAPLLNDEAIMSVSCLACNAQVNELCVSIRASESKHSLQHFHQPRKMAAYRKIMGESLPKGVLDDAQKSMIAYYAFVCLADSVSLKSEAILGRAFSSKDIQMFFVQRAIAELGKDGLV